MTQLAEDVGGKTESVGLDDYLISDDLGNFSPFTDLVDGEEYVYKVFYADGETIGKEVGLGTWDAGTSTLSRDSVNSSKHAGITPGDPVPWGAGEKYIFIVDSIDTLCDMEKMVAGPTKTFVSPDEKDAIAANSDAIVAESAARASADSALSSAIAGKQNQSAVLDATTASFLVADRSKLDSLAFVGTTQCANNTADIVLVSTPVDIDGNPASAFDGKLVRAFVRYPDNATAGYEEVWGIYTHSTKTIARTTVGQSSAGEGVKVNWGSSAIKHVAIALAYAPIADTLSSYIDRSPWWVSLVGCTGQSGAEPWLRYRDQTVGLLPAADSRFKDWGPPSSNIGSASRSWTTVTPTTLYSGTAMTPAQVGCTGRRMIDYFEWSQTFYMGHPANAFCRRMIFLTGRPHWLINVARGSTGINDATYGWGYDPSVTTRVSTIFAAEVAAAVAAMILADSRQTGNDRLQHLLYIQGETDDDLGTSNVEFGHLLAHYFWACENGHNITNSNTQYIAFLANQDSQDTPLKGQQFGHLLARDLFGERFHVVNVQNTKTFDNLHTWGEDADEKGYRAAEAVVSGNSNPGASLPLVMRKVTTSFATAGGIPYEGDLIALNSTPSTNGQICFTTGRGTLRVNKMQYINGAYADISAAGLRFYKAGDILSIVKKSVFAAWTAGGSASVNRTDVLLTKPAVDKGTYLEWTGCTTTDSGASLAAPGDDVYLASFTDPNAIKEAHNFRRLFDGTSFRWMTTETLEFPNLVGRGTPDFGNTIFFYGTNQTATQIEIDDEGVLKTSDKIPVKLWTITSGTTPIGLFIFGIQDAEMHYFDLTITVSDYAVPAARAFRIYGSGSRSGSTYTLQEAFLETITNSNTSAAIDSLKVPEPTIAAYSSNPYGPAITLTGLSGKDLYWDLEGTLMLL